METTLDQSLSTLEVNAERLSTRPPTSREQAELDLLNDVDQVASLVDQLNQAENRGLLEHLLGPPYTRIARIRYLLKSLPLNETNKSDARLKRLSDNCDIAESALRNAPEGHTSKLGVLARRKQVPRKASSGEYYSERVSTDKDSDFSSSSESESNQVTQPLPTSSAEVGKELEKSACKPVLVNATLPAMPSFESCSSTEIGNHATDEIQKQHTQQNPVLLKGATLPVMLPPNPVEERLGDVAVKESGGSQEKSEASSFQPPCRRSCFVMPGMPGSSGSPVDEPINAKSTLSNVVVEQGSKSQDETKCEPEKVKTAKSVQIQSDLPESSDGQSRILRQRQTLTSPAVGEALFFAEEPRGPFTVVVDGTTICRGLEVTNSDEPRVPKRGAFTRMADGVGMLAKASGLSHGNMYHTRKKLLKLDGGVPDEGCTAISEVPIQKFGLKGQYAEVEVVNVKDSPIGCVGIGVTRQDPDSWRLIGMKFPDRFDAFPAESWVFSGPYRGSTCRLYVDGKKYYKYQMPPKDKAKTRWTQGDRVGVLIRNDDKLCLYLNHEVVVSVHTPGISSKLAESDFYLLVEAYGYVRSVCIVTDAVPRGLDMPEDAVVANVT